MSNILISFLTPTFADKEKVVLKEIKAWMSKK